MLPLAIWVMKGFYDSISWDVEMSALVDGATRMQAWSTVMLPQVMPGIASISIFAFIYGWSEYIYVITFIQDKDSWTLASYINTIVGDFRFLDYGLLSATALFYIAPVLLFFFFTQKYLMRVTIGGTKRGQLMMAEIRLKGLTKTFGSVVAVDDVNLRISDGELLALLGPSGCGKTTALLMLAGIYKPTRGEIYFDDVMVNDVPPKGRGVGLVFQSYALYPHMTVYDNIAFPLRLRRTPKVEIDRRVKEVARLAQIDELLAGRPAQLSGGQQQRVAFAEPLSGSRTCCCWTNL